MVAWVATDRMKDDSYLETQTHTAVTDGAGAQRHEGGGLKGDNAEAVGRLQPNEREKHANAGGRRQHERPAIGRQLAHA